MTSSSPYRRLLASVLVAALAVLAAACGETKNSSSSGSSSQSSSTASSSGAANAEAPIPKGLKTVSIPKQLGNPYEEFEHSGVDGGAEGARRQQPHPGLDRRRRVVAGAADQLDRPAEAERDHHRRQRPERRRARPSSRPPSAGSRSSRWTRTSRPDARSVFVNQVTTKLVGENQVESIAKQIGNKGQIAILSATANATNQNAWIKVMKDTLKQPKYKDIKLVKVAYGDDDDQKSFQQMQGLIQAYPNLKGVISPTTVGVAAAARYLSTSPEKGKVKLTGLGFPNQMRKFVDDGTVDEFQLWVPKDVGYLAGQAAAALVAGRITGKQGETFTAGRLGKYTIGANGEIVLGPLTTFNKENIGKFDF